MLCRKKFLVFWLCVLPTCVLWTFVVNNWHTLHEGLNPEPQSLLRRRSVTLTDDMFTYHLNLTHYEAEFPQLQSYNCALLEDRAGFCHSSGGTPLLLLLAMKSHPSSSDRRAALRQTWAVDGEVSGYRVKHLFLMATTPSQRCMNLLQEEIKEFQDILLWDFTESHHNLSLKERCFIEWVHHSCKEAEFIFKGDDDELANPEGLVKYVRSFSNYTRTLHGAVQHHAMVVRGGKYRVTHSLYPLKRYPHFLSGGGFIVPRAAVPALYRASAELPVFPLDDVYLGLLSLAANVTLRHSPRFHVFGLKYEICHYKAALVVHGVSLDRLVQMWRDLQEADCEPRFRWKR